MAHNCPFVGKHIHTLSLQAHTHSVPALCQALTLTHSSTAAGKKPNGLWASRGGRGRACKWSESRHMGGGWLLGQLGEFFRPKWVRFYPPTKKVFEILLVQNRFACTHRLTGIMLQNIQRQNLTIFLAKFVEITIKQNQFWWDIYPNNF